MNQLKNASINDKTIEAETQIPALLKMKLTIDEAALPAKQRLAEIKSRAQVDDKYADPKAYGKLIGFITRMGFLSQKIQIRIAELKAIRKAMPPEQRVISENRHEEELRTFAAFKELIKQEIGQVRYIQLMYIANETANSF